MAARSLGYTLENTIKDNERRYSARFDCKGCPAVLHIPLKAGNNNPEAIAKLGIQEGWAVDAFRASKNRCPACQHGRRGANDTESEIMAFQRRKATVAPDTDPQTAVTPEPVAPITPAPPATPPTPAQRTTVRRLIEKHFDVETGEYAEGRSDETIATEACVQPSLVTLIRDAGYGPILVTEAMRGMRRNRDALMAEAAAIETSAAAKAKEKHERVQQEIAELLAAASDRAAGLLRQADELDAAYEAARKAAGGEPT